MPKSKRRRFRNEVNAGSMADIAFLLLIFFLVTTQIDVDKGIFVKLPFWQVELIVTDISNRNVFSIKINREDKLLVEGEVTSIERLREKVKTFVLNPFNDPTLSSVPNKAVVALQNDRGTSYSTYLQVYNEIKMAYNELWEERAMKQHGLSFLDLSRGQKQVIKNQIPSVISESEPTSF